MYDPAVAPPDVMRSVYGPKPRTRAVDLLDVVSVPVSTLFPDAGERIYVHGEDLTAITRAAERSLAPLDMGMIKPEHTVKILSSEHGYSIMGGEPYVTMLRALKDSIQKKTGCTNVQLMVGAYKGFRESNEFIEEYDLNRRFDGQVQGYGPYDQDLPVETQIGTVYAIKKIFDGDWFVHAYYDDPREIYYNRQIQRAYKPFGMSYVRFETRSIYHMNFGNRSSNFLPMAVFNSPTIQQRYAFSCVLRHSPGGVLTVDADRDLAALDRRITVSHLRKYGKMLQLFHEIDECIVVLDGGRWGFYLHAGGVIFGTFMHAHDDQFDLSNPKVLGGFKKNAQGEVVPMLINPAIKTIVINQAWPGINYLGLEETPILMVGKDQADLWRADHCNPYIADHAQVVPDLQSAMATAQQLHPTDNVMIFDGNFGHINCSPAMARQLIEKAPEAGRKVEEELLPLWLGQRGISMEEAGVRPEG